MADTDLAVEGKDTSIVVTYNGVPIKAYEAVRWEVEPIMDVQRTKPLGTTAVQIDSIPNGWKGTLEIDVSRKEADELLDTMNAASLTRVPGILAFTSTTLYRDLTKKTYTYLDCKIVGFNTTTARGEKTKTRIQWETGLERVAM